MNGKKPHLILANRIGFGTWQIGGETQSGTRQTGWGKIDEKQAIEAIHFAVDNGITFFDTADGYGEGRSETILGKALKQIAHSDVKICTKIGTRWDDDGSVFQDFSVSWLEKAIEGCLSRLQVENIDTLLLHSPPIDFDWNSYDLSFFDKLIDRGIINRYGVSIKSLKAMPTIQSSGVGSIVEAVFNALDRRLSAYSAEHPNYQYIARVPLSSGFLTEKTFSENPIFGAKDIRQYIPTDDVKWMTDNVRKLGFLHELHGGLEVSALRFCISFDSITVAIPGMYKIKHVKSALLAHELGPLPKVILDRIEETITGIPDNWK